MYNLTVLHELLETGEFKVDDEGDTQFALIASFFEKDDFENGIPLIEEVLLSGRLDIRLVMYYLYSWFLKEGLVSFIEIFPIIMALLKDHWEQVCPVTKRDRHAQKSLTWLFSRQIKTFEYIDRDFKKGNFELLDQYKKDLDDEKVDEILSLSFGLNDYLMQKWEHSPLNDQLAHLRKWIQDVNQMSIPVEEKEASEKDEVVEKAPPIEETSPIPLRDLQPSDLMVLFYKKLCAFESLLNRKEYRKAAVIADDIEQAIQNFNPLLHFPSLFVRHFSLHAKYAHKLEENRDSNTSKILEKLYQADLNAFINWR